MLDVIDDMLWDRKAQLLREREAILKQAAEIDGQLAECERWLAERVAIRVNLRHA